MGLPSVLFTPFAGAHNTFSIGYHGWPVEALSKHIFDQGSRRGMVTVDPTVDIAQQKFSLFARDTEL